MYLVKRQLDGYVNEQLGLSNYFGAVPDGSSGDAYKKSFSSRQRITLEKLHSLKSNIRRQQQNRPSDAAAVQALVEQLEAECGDDSPVLFYQHQQVDSDSGDEVRPFILVLCGPFQRAMLQRFGRQLIFMDGTGKTAIAIL